jgi:hypothetical protein
MAADGSDPMLGAPPPVVLGTFRPDLAARQAAPAHLTSRWLTDTSSTRGHELDFSALGVTSSSRILALVNDQRAHPESVDR